VLVVIGESDSSNHTLEDRQSWNAFGNTDAFLVFMEAQPDVSTNYVGDDSFSAEWFKPGDIVLIEQKPNDEYRYAHAMIVTYVDNEKGVVWINELSGSATRSGREFRDAKSHFYHYVIIRIEEYDYGR